MRRTSLFATREVFKIDPSKFFDAALLREEFGALNNFIYGSFEFTLQIGSFSDTSRIYLAPRIKGQTGYFLDSKLTEGGFIKGNNFEELMYKLCAMIIGEHTIQAVSHDYKDLHRLSFAVESKELYPLLSCHADEGHKPRRQECRSCGAQWPLG